MARAILHDDDDSNEGGSQRIPPSLADFDVPPRTQSPLSDSDHIPVPGDSSTTSSGAANTAEGGSNSSSPDSTVSSTMANLRLLAAGTIVCAEMRNKVLQVLAYACSGNLFGLCNCLMCLLGARIRFVADVALVLVCHGEQETEFTLSAGIASNKQLAKLVYVHCVACLCLACGGPGCCVREKEE